MRTTIILFWLFMPFYLLARQPVVSGLQHKSSLVFIENKGQITDQYYNQRADIDFKLNAPGMDIFIGDGEMHYQWVKKIVNKESKDEDLHHHKSESTDHKCETYRLDVELLGANKNAQLITEEQQGYYENYYLPSCPDGAAAHAYKKVTYKNIYPHIDWVIYVSSPTDVKTMAGNAGALKYDFIVHPGGNAKNIKLQYKGATKLSVANNGSLTAITPFGSITENAPYSYQIKNEKEKSKNAVVSKFVLDDNVLSFDVAPYAGILVIDPILEWATYYGGIGDDQVLPGGHPIAADDDGYTYMTGYTRSPNIATSGSYQNIHGGLIDGFLTKYGGNGFLEWATYYGGSNSDVFESVSCSGNNVFAAGYSSSKGLGTVGTHKPQLDSPQAMGMNGNDGIFVKFSADGKRAWSTYFGGRSYDEITDIVTAGNRIYIAGITSSNSGIATTGAHQALFGGLRDNFLARFDTSGNRINASYYGGGGFEGNAALALDRMGNLYMLGNTNSNNNIATVGSHKVTHYEQSVYLAKFDTTILRQWGTYYGADSANYEVLISGNGVVADEDGNVYICGSTDVDNNIATPGSQREKLYEMPGDQFKQDGFLVKFNSTGIRQWGTYFGGSDFDELISIVVDKNNDLCIAGHSDTVISIATAGAWRNVITGLPNDRHDGTFVKFDRNGHLLWATNYGGDYRDIMSGIAVDVSNNVYLCGIAMSPTDIATPGRQQDQHGGGEYDAFIIKSAPDSVVHLGFVDTVICINSTNGYLRIDYAVSRSFRPGNVFTVQLSDSNGSFASHVVIGTKAATYSGHIDCNIPATTPRATGYRVRILSSAPYYISPDNGKDIRITDGPEYPIATGDTFLCTGKTLNLSATCATPGVSFMWTGPNGFTETGANTIRPAVQITDSGNYIVTVSPYECRISDTVHLDVSKAPARPRITHNAPICGGDTLEFSQYQDFDDIDMDAEYSWIVPDTSLKPQSRNTIYDVPASFGGTYISIAAINNCITTDTAYIQVKHQPVLTVTSNSPLQAGDTLRLAVTADSADTYAWTGPDGFMSEDTNIVLVNVTSFNDGNYTVTATHNSCIDSATTYVEVRDREDNYFVLFPNPNDGSFIIKGNLRLDQQIQLVVTNTLGQVIYKDKATVYRKLLNHRVTLPAVANGTYFLRLRINGKDNAIPFTVKR